MRSFLIDEKFTLLQKILISAFFEGGIISKLEKSSLTINDILRRNIIEQKMTTFTFFLCYQISLTLVEIFLTQVHQSNYTLQHCLHIFTQQTLRAKMIESVMKKVSCWKHFFGQFFFA